MAGDLRIAGPAPSRTRISDPDDSPLERYEEGESQEEIARRRERKIDSIYGSWRSGAQKKRVANAHARVGRKRRPAGELRWIQEARLTLA